MPVAGNRLPTIKLAMRLTLECIPGSILLLVETAMNPKRPLRSGDLSRAAGVSTDTLRHYEKLGILKKPPRTQGGYRVYPPESVDRVLLIRNSLDSGFTLKELTVILQLRDSGSAPCRHVRELAHGKVRQLDIQIEHLTQLRDSLRTAVQEWDRRLEKTPPCDRANLLESLSPIRRQHNVCAKGDTDEDTRAYRVLRNSGFGVRARHNVQPRAKTAPEHL